MAPLAARTREVFTTLSATDGATCKIDRNSLTELTNTARSVVAVAVAVCASQQAALFRPRSHRSPTCATRAIPSPVSRETSAVPAPMTMNSLRAASFAF